MKSRGVKSRRVVRGKKSRGKESHIPVLAPYMEDVSYLAVQCPYLTVLSSLSFPCHLVTCPFIAVFTSPSIPYCPLFAYGPMLLVGSPIIRERGSSIVLYSRVLETIYILLYLNTLNINNVHRCFKKLYTLFTSVVSTALP